LTAPARDAPARLRSGRRNGRRGRTKEWDLTKEKPRAFGRVITPAFPNRGPDAGTTDQVRPQSGSWHQTTQTVDWPTYPLQTPSGGGRLRRPRTEARPRRKDARKWRKGIDKPRPVTEARIERSEIRVTVEACRSLLETISMPTRISLRSIRATVLRRLGALNVSPAPGSPRWPAGGRMTNTNLRRAINPNHGRSAPPACT
jgi:hypothetical protein